jgi:hypothetical protein
MSKKCLILLGIIAFFFSCKPAESPPTDTITTATTDTTATPPAPPPAHEYKLDHFKFWRVKPSQYTEKLRLFGQADKDWWDASLTIAEIIANPVRKKHDGVVIGTQYPLHYVGYRFEAKPQPPRKVVLSNQITKDQQETWIITDPMWLLTPAGKQIDGRPEPQKGDHFVCYKVHAPKPFPVNIELQDQFDVKFQKWEKVAELTPDYFCIPVQKRRDGKPPEELIDPETHLAVYFFKPDVLTTPLTANTIDQFSRHKLEVVQSGWLAVPSRKYGRPEPTDLPK